jgi:transcriptional regulator with XRE-family HTH domain
MPDISVTFRLRVEKAISESKFNSISKVAQTSGLSSPTLQKILRGEFDNSRGGPGVFAMQRLAEALEKPLSYFFDQSVAERNKELGSLNGTSDGHINHIPEFLEAHWRGGKLLEAFDHLVPHFDLYMPPSDVATGPKIVAPGQQTLLSRRIGDCDPLVVQRELDHLPQKTRFEIIDFHRRSMQNDTAVSNSFIDHRLKDRPVHVRAGYSRLGLFVTNQAGKTFILIHCSPIPV